MPTEHIQPRFNILSEGTPQRCDICHQSDQFDPATGTCARCAAVPVPSASATFGTDILRRFDIPERFRELVLREVGEEAVLWAGRPRTVLWGEMFWGTVLAAWVAAVAISIAFSFTMGALLLSCIISLIFPNIREAWRRFFRIRRLIYVVTENRVLILLGGSEISVTSFYPNQIQKLVSDRKPGGSGNLLFCDSITNREGEKSFDNGFYGIENLSEVERIVRTRLVEKSPS